MLRSPKIAAIVAEMNPGSGCGVFEQIVPSDIDEVGPEKYKLEFLRCEAESVEETIEAFGPPGPGGKRSPLVVVEYRITNLDEVRRRFDIRPVRIDANGVERSFTPKDSDRLDPGESSVEQVRGVWVESDVPPFTCSAEVWESLIDKVFPDD